MERRAKRGAWLFGALSLALVVFIFTRSLKPAELSGEESEAVTGFLRTILERFIEIPEGDWDGVVRKIAHFCEFAALGFCVKGFAVSVGDLRGQAYRSLPLLACLLTAICDELLQTLMPGRSCEVRDVVLDFIGAVAGVLVLLLCRKLLSKKQ